MLCREVPYTELKERKEIPLPELQHRSCCRGNGIIFRMLLLRCMPALAFILRDALSLTKSRGL